MPIIYIPSSAYGGNSQGNLPFAQHPGFAHPFHGTIGGLQAGIDPRNRGRIRSQAEIDAASRAAYLARQQHLDEIKRMHDERLAAEADAASHKSLQAQANRSRMAIANNPKAAANEMARQQTEAEDTAKREALAARGGKAVRLSPEEQKAAYDKRVLASQQTEAEDKDARDLRVRESLAAADELRAAERATARTAAQAAYDKRVIASQRYSGDYGPHASEDTISSQMSRTEPASTPAAPEYHYDHDTRIAPDVSGHYDTTASREYNDEVGNVKPGAGYSASAYDRIAPESGTAGGVYSGLVSPAKTRNPEIANAFAVPSNAYGQSASSLAPKFSPEEESRRSFATKHMLASANPAVPAIPNQIAGELGNIVGGIANHGLNYFNADAGEQAEARDVLNNYFEEQRKQRELESLYGPAAVPVNRLSGPRGYMRR
jgi:hypothetical protein